jgi:plasmid stabilization system protein ParE
VIRIRWAPAAAEDLEAIYTYLREHHPAFAHATIRSLYDAARSLKQFPRRGPIGRLDGTREFVMAPLPYIIVYGVEIDVVHIFGVVQGSQDCLLNLGTKR